MCLLNYNRNNKKYKHLTYAERTMIETRILKNEVHRSCALRFITDIISSKQFICH